VAVLGLPGFRLVASDEVDGELEVTVATTAQRAWCGSCGVQAHSQGRPVTLVCDVDAVDRCVRLRWVKRRWRCPEPACATGTWTEASAHIAPRAVLTERACWQATRRVGRDGESVAAVARSLGTGWHTIMAAVGRRGQPLVR
jgi:transposase